MARVVVLGSTNTDMTVRLDRLPAPGETRLGGEFATGPGGKGANQAVAACRAGGLVIFLTALGDDSLGRQALDYYAREGVDVGHASIVAGVPSGVALILVGEGGENLIGVAPGANGRLTPGYVEALPDRLFRPDAVFLASLEIPVDTVVAGLRRARAAGMTCVLNPAPIHPSILEPDVLELIDLLTPNREEARELAGVESLDRGPTGDLSAARRLRARGVGRLVITLGAEGCLVASDDGYVLVPAPAVEAVDTVGAGDAFNGALAVALAEGLPLTDAAKRACAAGALAVTQPGAQGASPRREQIDRLTIGAPPARVLADA